MEREIPGAGLVVLENAGHFAYLDKLYDFLRIMDAYLFETYGPGAQRALRRLR